MNYLLEININRFSKGLGYTVGRLSYVGYDESMKVIENNPLFCNTMEDVVRVLRSSSDKIPGETAIPAGKYEIKMSYSSKFERILPLLLNVPFFTGIRIHRGNTHEHTEGCILVGKNNVRGMVTNSAFWEAEICKLISKYKYCWLEIG
jgi:hypothetical protein